MFRVCNASTKGINCLQIKKTTYVSAARVYENIKDFISSANSNSSSA